MSEEKLGDIGHTIEGDCILTGIQHIPSGQGMFLVQTWTPIPDGMRADDLGHKFRAASTAVLLQPFPPRQHLRKWKEPD